MNTAELLAFPKGSTITFTTGEYSDFRTAGTVTTLRDCALPDLAQEFAAEPNAGYRSLSDFVSWLIAKGHAEVADVSEVHLGAYGSFEPEFGVPNDWDDET